MPPLSVRDVASLLLIPLLFYLFLWFWLDTDPDLQPGLFDFEDDEALDRENQRNAKEPYPDVVEAEVELGMDLPGDRGLCPPESFKLATMETCTSWLGCKEIADEVTVQHMLGQGAVKQVYKATWRGHTVVYSNLTEKAFQQDFLHGVEMLRNMQHTSHVVQLVGSCHTTLLTEYYRLGSAENIETVLDSEEFSKLNNVWTRFNVALSYLEAIHFLHNSPIGTRVMCDSNDLFKTLSQFLITEDLKLVLNDLDALPEVNPEAQLFVKCGRQEIVSDFVAPEQLWPFESEPFEDSRMPSYDEKTDIWKIPAVVDYLLGNVDGSDVVRLHLFKVHQQCHNKNPTQRPSAKVLLKEYKRVRNTLFPKYIA
ncbi:PREDICTED: protein O-mannose kinase-like [Branchiostoma belcheri]|uniref:Protein O-mannose kinase n=1 Tax=Branchiostoma belcheri TaxID=7741 RepID=A0A6P4YEV6_BRABE|nr:PREDICTED: protein O-mannose kinase-like [Branchiostoma belcheri]